MPDGCIDQTPTHEVQTNPIDWQYPDFLLHLAVVTSPPDHLVMKLPGDLIHMQTWRIWVIIMAFCRIVVNYPTSY